MERRIGERNGERRHYWGVPAQQQHRWHLVVVFGDGLEIINKEKENRRVVYASKPVD